MLRQIGEENAGVEQKIDAMFRFEVEERMEGESAVTETNGELLLRSPTQRGGDWPYYFNYCRISEVISTTLESSQIQTDNGPKYMKTTMLDAPQILLVSFVKKAQNAKGQKFPVKAEKWITVPIGSNGRTQTYVLKSIIHHSGVHQFGHYTV